MLLDALLLQLGYNATLVAIGAALLGTAAGITGTFLFLRKRALVSDAVSHATLPGVCIAFLLMAALGGDGRNLAGLLLGSAVSAGAGLWCMNWLTRNTRLAEDAAIGAVLSVFFGFGVVLLTVIQTLGIGRQAGLEGFLLGSTAGMLYSDALVIALGGAATLFLVLLTRRPMTLVAFDPEYAAARGLPVSVGLKALVFKIKGSFTVLALRADQEVDNRSVRRALRAQKLRFARLEELARQHGTAPFMRVSAAFSDGERLFAVRYSSDHIAPSLYYRWSESRQGWAVVSEPLEQAQDGWSELPPGQALELGAEGIKQTAFLPKK